MAGMYSARETFFCANFYFIGVKISTIHLRMRKKKAKYRSLLINKKRYYFYKIVWADILGDSGHADAAEFTQMKPAIMETYAYVFNKDKKCLRTFASYDTNSESFSDRNVFPLGCVQKMEKIPL